MQPGRGEGNSTPGTQRCLCPDPELNWAHCQGQAPAPILTKPKCLIQTSASTEIFLCGPLHQPCALGNPLVFPSFPQTLLHIKSTWDLEILAASQHPVQRLFPRMNHSESWQANREIHTCLYSPLPQGTGTETCISCRKKKKRKVFGHHLFPASPQVEGCAALGPRAVTSDAVSNTG